ncbi:MAG: hypothetical protein JGK30_24375 [Microcoleus sp. PH2017_40_RAT_O_B]|uniref:hypothetical protein n=1 Tax=unclassified Microcoleus TaxID=2642155 RepID=UPI001D75CE8B|nr:MULTISPECIES: hypothetical protein [unclassified Microcoleus]MCC3574907.1 hypothetical protein [Microcoleus sp. PH2017_34_RAT_O_A]MCC3612527.1 hypothetical protein [Microcoleus sp. PH2017_40_RAT_O_B]
MNSLLLISPDRAWGFKPILSGKILQVSDNTLRNWNKNIATKIKSASEFERAGDY